MEWLSAESLRHLIAAYGYGGIAVIVGLESMGVPLPGETVLVVAALYAGSHHDMSLLGVMVSAATGAIVGDNIGYWLGREFGYRLLLRYGRYVQLTDARIKLGQYLFLRHGSKVVFLGRFIPILRVLAGVLAGTNRMPWHRFLVANAAGAMLWAVVLATGAYAFGRALLRMTGPAALLLFLIGAAVLVAAALFIRSHEGELEAEAQRALPGPLEPARRARRPPSLRRGKPHDPAAR